MGSYIPPPAFHTFDPIRISPYDVIGAISKSMLGEHGDLLESVSGLRGISLEEGSPPTVDRATLLFISILDWQGDGSSPKPLDSGHSMERLGRFPSNDGNAIEYLLEYTGEGEGRGSLHLLLSKLCRGLSEESLGESGFSRGSGGIELLGWLDATEVSDLRKEVERGGWSVLSREPLDGGVQDAFRHLLVFLRAAGRSKCGLLMRRHS
ncbi:MAG: hypothetical protein CMA88_04205 [Euryarchaeota archaeon]|nr:hypothetical protein [Euryarchaeota archaeon]